MAYPKVTYIEQKKSVAFSIKRKTLIVFEEKIESLNLGSRSSVVQILLEEFIRDN